MSSNRNTGATNRLKQDYLRLKGDPIPYVVAEPVPANILECSVAGKCPPQSVNLRRNRSQKYTNNSAKCRRNNEILQKYRQNRDILCRKGAERSRILVEISTASQRRDSKRLLSPMCSNSPLACPENSDESQKYTLEGDKSRKYIVKSDNECSDIIELGDSPMSQFDSSARQMSSPVDKSLKCIKKGMKKTIRRYNSAPKAMIEKALQRINVEKITVSEASRLYNISKGTLINRIHNKHQKRFGRPNTLTNLEENKLADYVKKLCDFGFSLSIVDIQVLASFENGTKLSPKNSRFGIQWSRSFVARHHLNPLKRPQSTNISKNLALREDASFFLEHVRSLLHYDETAISPDCIFCCEEFHLSGNPRSNQSVVRKNLRYPVQMPTEKSCVSVMFCGNACGSWLPFYVVKKSSENVTSCNISKSANIDKSRNNSHSAIVSNTNDECVSPSKSTDSFLKSDYVNANEDNTNSTIFFLVDEDSNTSVANTSVVNTCGDLSRSTNFVNECNNSLNFSSVNNTDYLNPTNVFDMAEGSVINNDIIPNYDNSVSTIFAVVDEGLNSTSVVSKNDDTSISTSFVETSQDTIVPTSIDTSDNSTMFYIVQEGSNSIAISNESCDVRISSKVVDANEDSSDLVNEISNLKFGVSKSGWFDSDVFTDWFENVFIKTAGKDTDKTVLICDNIPRNINSKSVKLAEENNVQFVVVPNNLRQWCQPFSGDFTKSLVRNWGDIVENWSDENSTDECLNDKDFPPLIEKLISRLFRDNSDVLLSAGERMASLSDGFEKCGIWPVDPERVISKIPDCEENELSYKDFNVELQNDDVFLLIKY